MNIWDYQVSSLAALLGTLATVMSATTAFLLYRINAKMNEFQKRAARQQSWSSLMQAINFMNATVLTDDKFLEVMDNLGHQPRGIKQQRRKKWLLFMFLNDLQLSYVGREDGLVDSEFAEPTLCQLLPMLMEDDVAFELVCGRGYDKRFRNHCVTVREKLGKSITAAASPDRLPA